MILKDQPFPLRLISRFEIHITVLRSLFFVLRMSFVTWSHEFLDIGSLSLSILWTRMEDFL